MVENGNIFNPVGSWTRILYFEAKMMEQIRTKSSCIKMSNIPNQTYNIKDVGWETMNMNLI